MAGEKGNARDASGPTPQMVWIWDLGGVLVLVLFGLVCFSNAGELPWRSGEEIESVSERACECCNHITAP